MHHDFTVLWGSCQGKHVLDRNLKKKKKKNLNTQDEFGAEIRFHIQLLPRLCHLIILQDTEAATDSDPASVGRISKHPSLIGSWKVIGFGF